MVEFLRSIWYLVVALTLTAALLLTLFRIVIAFIGALEHPINRVFLPEEVSVSGLDGVWFTMNPRVTVDELRFAGGIAHDVDFEIATIESLWRNRFVARRFHIAELQLELAHTESRGWHLLGSDAAAANFDFWDFLRYSDDLDVAFALRLVRAAHVQQFSGSVQSVELNNLHNLRLELRANDACSECSLVLSQDWRTDTPLPSEIRNTLEVSSHAFQIDPVLLGMDFTEKLTLSSQFHWSAKGNSGAGLGDIYVSTQNPTNTYTYKANIRAAQRDDHILLNSQAHEVATSSDVVPLPPFVARIEDDLWQIELAEFEIAPVATVFATLIGSDQVLGEWLQALSVSGVALDFATVVDDQGYVFRSQMSGVKADGYLAFPALNIEGIEARGTHSTMLIETPTAAFEMHVEDYFESPWQARLSDATFLTRLDSDALAFASNRVKVAIEDVQTLVSFGYTRAINEDAFLFAVQVATSEGRLDLATARDYIPTTLDLGTRKWMDENVKKGLFSNTRLAYLNTNDETLTAGHTEVALTSAFDSAAIAYHPDWHPVADARGSLTLNGSHLHLFAYDVAVANASVARTHVDLPLEGPYFQVQIQSNLDTATLLDFVNSTPLSAMTGEVMQTWAGDGDVDLSADLILSYAGAEPRAGDLDVDLMLNGATLHMRDLNLPLKEVTGLVEYTSPDALTSGLIRATLFGHPITVSIDSLASGEQQPPLMQFLINGETDVDAIAQILGIEDDLVVKGATQFAANLNVYPGSETPSTLDAASDLVGLTIDLPAPLAKPPNVVRSTGLHIRFHEAFTRVSIGSDVLSGTIHYNEGEILGGSLGVNAQPPRTVVVPNELALSGRVSEAQLDLADMNTALPVSLHFENFEIGRVEMPSFPLHDVVLTGHYGADEIDLTIKSRELDGHLEEVSGVRLAADIQQLRIPGTGEAVGSDPLTPDILSALPAMDINIDDVVVIEPDGTEDRYGSWRLRLTPVPTGLEISNLDAHVKGLHVTDLEEANPGVWDAATNRTSYAALVRGENLGTVLPDWGYEVNIESDRFELQGHWNWEGSPLNFGPTILRGDLTATARDGRFIDVAGVGPLRVAGLLNFSAILKRLQLDFSDVVEKGFAFDDVYVDASLNEGILTFNQPLKIDGPGSQFRINGSVDLDTTELNNEMIVTLPLRSALPWYLVIANPASGIGVLLGAQTIATDLFTTLASGKYAISGTLEDPEVELIGLLRSDLSPQDASQDSPVQTDPEAPNAETTGNER